MKPVTVMFKALPPKMAVEADHHRHQQQAGLITCAISRLTPTMPWPLKMYCASTTRGVFQTFVEMVNPTKTLIPAMAHIPAMTPETAKIFSTLWTRKILALEIALVMFRLW